MKDPRRTLLLIVKDDQILLAMKKRGFGAGLWNGVGGKIESNETIEQALVRECQEEIGVTPLEYEKISVINFYGGSEPEGWHMLVHAYLCTKWQGEPVETEEMAPQWFKYSAIPYNQMWQDDQLWLPRVLKGEKLTGTFYFDKDDKIITYNLATAGAKDLS